MNMHMLWKINESFFKAQTGIEFQKKIIVDKKYS